MSPDGRAYSVSYTAGAGGFVASGDHLPVAPALPPALQRWEDAKNGKIRGNGGAGKKRQSKNRLKMASFILKMASNVNIGPKFAES